MRNFTAFDEGADGPDQAHRQAAPVLRRDQGRRHAPSQAVETNGKAGVVWHTQGSGKSMEMELYANLVSRAPQAARTPPSSSSPTAPNSTASCSETFDRSLLLAEKPDAGARRAPQLRDELQQPRHRRHLLHDAAEVRPHGRREATPAREHPLLSDRRNIIVVVDEAHRSHYDDLDGYARHLRDALPNATLIAFTGTPISFADRNTRDVFGDYIDIYDLTRAVDDGATVPVYFEPRLIKVALRRRRQRGRHRPRRRRVTRSGSTTSSGRGSRQSVAVVNAVYGAPERIATLAADLVAHWENRRARDGAVHRGAGQGAHRRRHPGDLRHGCTTAIVALRPDWHSDALDKGRIKVVYSGTRIDQPPVSDHVRRDSENKAIKERLKDADDELELVIVKDMMLTGFDAPPLHTLYLDRPLKGALLMQTLARVNRTFRGKQDGLLVAYAPLADNLAQGARRVHRQPTRRTSRSGATSTRPSASRPSWSRRSASCSPATTGARCCARAAREPGCTAATGARPTTCATRRRPATPSPRASETLASRLPHGSPASSPAPGRSCPGAESLARTARPRSQFYEEVRVWMAKFDADGPAVARRADPRGDRSGCSARWSPTATATGEVLDIYEAAGLPKPRLDDLGPEFLAKAQAAPNPHLAIEALREVARRGVGTATARTTWSASGRSPSGSPS